MKALKKYFCVLILLLPYVNIHAQSSVYNIQDCTRYQLVINYLRNHNELKNYLELDTVVFKIESTVLNTAVPQFGGTRRYYVGLMNLNEKQFHYDDPAVKPVLDSLSLVEQRFKKVAIKCLKGLREKKPNVGLSFGSDKHAVSAFTRSTNPGYGRGIDFIFFFDDRNNIRNVVQTEWTE